MNNCPTCGAPKPNDDWDWQQETLWNAAPELLAACKEMVLAFDRGDTTDEIVAVRSLRAAIDKAEGRGE